MNINQYEREAQKFHTYSMQLHNFLDKIRGVIDLSSYEDVLGRMTNDSLDKVKGVLFFVERRVRDQRVTPDLLFTVEGDFTQIKKDFGDDPSVNIMLDQIYNSLSWLRIYQDDVDDDNIEDDEE